MNKKAGKETKASFSYNASVGVLLNEGIIKRTKEESRLIEQGRVLLLSERKNQLKKLNVKF